MVDSLRGAVVFRMVLGVTASCALAACDSQHGTTPSDDGWQLVQRDLPGALLSVWGRADDDVWAVGADARDGSGPLVLHFDGSAWTREATGLTQGDLWWVFGTSDGTIYFGGNGGVIVRHRADTYEVMDTPGTGTVYGLWGAGPDDVWAVGGDSDASGGFAWRLVGDGWQAEASLPADVPANAALWKAYGTAADDVWLVGSNGVALHWDGAALTPGETGVGSSLFTVHEHGGLWAAVGGLASGIIVESDDGMGWHDVTPTPPPMGLAGVTLGDDGTGVAVGFEGTVYIRHQGMWVVEDPGLRVRQSLHGSWIDESGGLWVVGGQTLTSPLSEGVLLHRGAAVPEGGI